MKLGFGSTNNGNRIRNNGRSFTRFKSVELMASIIGSDENLLKRLSVILDVINIPINIPKFAEYCRETAHLYEESYPWYDIYAERFPQDTDTRISNCSTRSLHVVSAPSPPQSFNHVIPLTLSKVQRKLCTYLSSS